MESKTHKTMDTMNTFLIGCVIGVVLCSLFALISYKKANEKQIKILEAYEQYYIHTETLLDSLDGTHNLDLMDTDLETDYGYDYLKSKSLVDSLTNSSCYHD